MKCGWTIVCLIAALSARPAPLFGFLDFGFLDGRRLLP